MPTCWCADRDLVLWYAIPSKLHGPHSLVSAPGSSKGRGTRAAGWFQDLLDDHQISDITSATLVDGIAGWAQAGEEYTQFMQEYDSQAWSKTK